MQADSQDGAQSPGCSSTQARAGRRGAVQVDDLGAGGSILFMRSGITNNSFGMRNSQDLEIIMEIKGVSVTKECYGLE